MSETQDTYKLDSLDWPKAKVQHILLEGTNTGYGLTIFSILDKDHRFVTYSYSIFNPKDKQFKKSVGRIIAMEKYLKGETRQICLTNLTRFMFSAKTILFLMLWDILSSIQDDKQKNPKANRSSRLIRDLRDQVFNTFMNLNIFSRNLL